MKRFFKAILTLRISVFRDKFDVFGGADFARVAEHHSTFEFRQGNLCARNEI